MDRFPLDLADNDDRCGCAELNNRAWPSGRICRAKCARAVDAIWLARFLHARHGVVNGVVVQVAIG